MMVNLILFNKSQRDLSQIFQSISIKFAFLNDKFEQVHQPVVCRDFLGDVIYSKNTGNLTSLYGFSYLFKENPCSIDHLYLSLKFPSIEGKNVFLGHLPLLHEKEKRAGTSLSIIYPTQYDDTIIIEGDKVWMETMWKFSLWSFFLKEIAYEDGVGLMEPEKSYRRLLTKEQEDKFLTKIQENIQDDYSRGMVYTHNFSGFYSILRGGCVAVANQLLG